MVKVLPQGHQTGGPLEEGAPQPAPQVLVGYVISGCGKDLQGAVPDHEQVTLWWMLLEQQLS